MTDPKDPKFVGVSADTPDSVVSSYQKSIRERAAKARDARPKIGDLMEADALYKPGQDRPMTIGQVTAAAARMNDADEEKKPTATLSDNTIAGLQALQVAAQAAHEKRRVMEQDKAAPLPPKPAIETEDEDAEGEDRTPGDVKRRIAADALSGLDDLEFERLMGGIQRDTINNSEQREAIEKLVPDFDLGKCLATGDWSQVVPVVPGKLEVTFRLVSPYENQAMRLLLFTWIDENPRRENIASDIYSLMNVVASLVQIGTSRLPNHLVGGEAYHETFDEAIFTAKYQMVARYPNPFIHMLGIHSAWFDMRVREAMKVTHLKDG